MYLKRIEMTGFKSFPTKTVLDFTKGITTIVGPNGSGKSNVSDAVRWVLGEMRPKLLRASGMQDVIFSGTQKRNPQNYAEVSIVIDNTNKDLKLDFSEVVITRKLMRSGESEYFINRTPCRMKDISELFMDTGLGKDGYSVVGQGKVDEIISGNAKDRRNFFEEASGISKYRHKKEEAQRKLVQTEDNLVRLNDIIGELAVRLPSLKRASGKALQYEEIARNLRESELKTTCFYIRKNREKTEELTQKREVLTKNTEKIKSELEELEKSSFDLSKKRREADLLIEELYKKEKDWEFNISAYVNQIRLYEQEIKHNEEEIANIIAERENDEKRLKKYKILEEEREKKINDLQANRERIEKEIRAYDDVLEKINKSEEEIGGLSQLVSSLEYDKTHLLIDKNTKTGSIKYLTELEKNYEGYQKSVKEVFMAIKSGKIKDVNVYGTLSDVIKTSKENATAFDAVLSGALQNIVVEDETDAKKIISYLKKHSLGRVTFLPRKRINEQNYNFKGAEKEKGVVGKAIDLLTFDKKFFGVVTSLLGKTLIVKSYEDGARISDKYNSEFRIVTQEGEVFRAGGAIVGGNILKQTGFMSKSADIEELKKQVSEAEAEISKKDNEILDLKGKISTLSKALEKEKEGLTELNEKKAYLNYVQRAIFDEIESQKNLVSEQNEYLRTMDKKQDRIEELKEKNESLLEDIEFKNEQISQAKENLGSVGVQNEEIKAKKEEIEKEVSELQEKQKEKHEELLKEEQKNSEVKNKIQNAQNAVEEDTAKIWEKYEITYSKALEEIGNFDFDITEEETRLKNLKNKMKSMGAVNTDAIKEYEEVNERFTFLTGQRDDLEKAKKELNGIIDEMEAVMKKEFKEKFELITQKFKETFRELFGGGQANLRLTEPDNLLESPIEIEVQPPGKKLENLSLLSGGEKAFTAVALLFSVLSLNPLPFCIFDEVEAALDEVNVYRFAQYLEKYKENTQFILISHRRGTMECADTLYGVAMQEKGVSTVVSLKVNDVLQD